MQWLQNHRPLHPWCQSSCWWRLAGLTSGDCGPGGNSSCTRNQFETISVLSLPGFNMKTSSAARRGFTVAVTKAIGTAQELVYVRDTCMLFLLLSTCPSIAVNSRGSMWRRQVTGREQAGTVSLPMCSKISLSFFFNCNHCSFGNGDTRLSFCHHAQRAVQVLEIESHKMCQMIC